MAKPNYRVQKSVWLYEEGYTLEEISETIGTTLATVKTYLIKENIEKYSKNRKVCDICKHPAGKRGLSLKGELFYCETCLVPDWDIKIDLCKQDRSIFEY